MESKFDFVVVDECDSKITTNTRLVDVVVVIELVVVGGESNTWLASLLAGIQRESAI